MAEDTEVVSNDVKHLKVTTGPFKGLLFPGHKSAEEFDREAGEVGACVEEADASICYRGTLPQFHEDFTEELQKLSGIERGVNQAATDKAKARSKSPDRVKDIPASFVDWANKIKASVDENVWKACDAAARALALTIKIDASPSTRQRGPAKDLLEKADTVLALDENAREEKLAKWLGMVESFDLDRDENGAPTRESVAKLAGEVLKTL